MFSRQLTWRNRYALFLLFPVVWSYLALFRLDNFMLAAAPAVAFLSLTTLWTGFVFVQYRRRTGSTPAAVLAGTFLLWGLHHLDYPLLRARGAWNPWGYYLDSLFLLAVAGGVLLLVIEELRQGLTPCPPCRATCGVLSGDDLLDALLQRPLALRGVRGAALFPRATSGAAPIRCVGDCLTWEDRRPPASIRTLVDEALRTGRPVLRSEQHPSGGTPPFTAVLPLTARVRRAARWSSSAKWRAPFAALDDSILVAVGEQIGAALENAELYRKLESRTRGPGAAVGADDPAARRAAPAAGARAARRDGPGLLGPEAATGLAPGVARSRHSRPGSRSSWNWSMPAGGASAT